MIFKNYRPKSVMVLKISKYRHIDDIQKILLIFQNYPRYSKNIADIKLCCSFS